MTGTGLCTAIVTALFAFVGGKHDLTVVNDTELPESTLVTRLQFLFVVFYLT